MPRKVVAILCNGPQCSRRNQFICDRLQQIQRSHKDLDIQHMGCQSRCEQGPNLTLDGRLMSRMTPITAADAVKRSLGLTRANPTS